MQLRGHFLSCESELWWEEFSLNEWITFENYVWSVMDHVGLTVVKYLHWYVTRKGKILFAFVVVSDNKRKVYFPVHGLLVQLQYWEVKRRHRFRVGWRGEEFRASSTHQDITGAWRGRTVYHFNFLNYGVEDFFGSNFQVDQLNLSVTAT